MLQQKPVLEREALDENNFTGLWANSASSRVSGFRGFSGISYEFLQKISPDIQLDETCDGFPHGLWLFPLDHSLLVVSYMTLDDWRKTTMSMWTAYWSLLSHDYISPVNYATKNFRFMLQPINQPRSLANPSIPDAQKARGNCFGSLEVGQNDGWNPQHQVY